MADRSKKATATKAAGAAAAVADAPAGTMAVARRPLTDDAPAPRGELTYEGIDTKSEPRALTAPDEPDVDQWERNDTYRGISSRPVTEEQAAALLEPPKDDELQIKPDQFGA